MDYGCDFRLYISVQYTKTKNRIEKINYKTKRKIGDESCHNSTTKHF